MRGDGARGSSSDSDGSGTTRTLRLRDAAANKPRDGGRGSRRGSPTTPQASYALPRMPARCRPCSAPAALRLCRSGTRHRRRPSAHCDACTSLRPLSLRDTLLPTRPPCPPPPLGTRRRLLISKRRATNQTTKHQEWRHVTTGSSGPCPGRLVEADCQTCDGHAPGAPMGLHRILNCLTRVSECI